jgi:DNA-binding SARP family transcriptional activator
MHQPLQPTFRIGINLVGSFNLKLFGGAALEGEHGTVHGRAAHKRRLALLALLAVARGRTVARERLIGYLWPESDGDSARHLLSESLYVLRKALGEHAFVTSGDEVGVDGALVACDVAGFEGAVAAGELERAVALYAGPFLDGFYVADAPEFERWAETERDRLARSYGRALESLAEAREAEGRWTDAVEWWQRRFTHDPFDSRTALRLMSAMDAAGQRGGAIRLAALHAALMREELGAEPEPAVLRLAERLRAEPAPAGEPPPRPTSHLLRLPPDAPPPPAEAEPAEPSPAPPHEATVPPAAIPDEAPRMRTGAARRLRHPWRSAAVALVVAALAAGVWASRAHGRAGGVSVAVFPLEPAAGAGPPAGPTPDELRRLFSSAFTLVPGLWTVDASLPRGTRGWREAPLSTLRRSARASGARYVAVPEVLSTAPIRISVSVRDTRDWELVGSYSSAPGEPLAGAVQRLGLMLAGGGQPRAPGLYPGELPARGKRLHGGAGAVHAGQQPVQGRRLRERCPRVPPLPGG